MSNTLGQRYQPVEAGRESVAHALAWTKARQVSLRNWLKSSLRAVFSGANREPSAWRALSAEYGPDEPISGAAWSDISSVGPQIYVDHYRTRI
jgi:hypothetical protein